MSEGLAEGALIVRASGLGEGGPCYGEDLVMDPEEFAVIGSFVERVSGIRMPGHKIVMAQARLAKRVRELGMESFGEYVSFAFHSPEGHAERANIIDVLTTNKTEFFREAEHFEYLSSTAIPMLVADDSELGRGYPLIVWSAGCATGEEAYSIAMTLAELTLGSQPLDFIVHASDISRKAIAKARLAVYEEERAAPVPLAMRRRHLLRSRDRSRPTVRVAKQIRRRVRFSRVNLVGETPPLERAADVVFCRNVLIYFDRATQVAVVRRIARAMRPRAYLFVGHAETLHGMDVPFDQVAPTVYRRR